MVYLHEFGWVFIYVFAFGISDFLVQKYIKTDPMYIFYYLFLGCIGLFILNTSKHFNSEKNTHM